MAGQKHPFSPSEVKRIKRYLIAENKNRDYLLFAIGLDSCLRGSDILNLRVCDLIGSHGPKDEINIIQKKTGRTTTIRLQGETKDYLLKFVEAERKKPESYLFTGRKWTGKPISQIQYSRLVKNWCNEIGLDPENYSTHSVRKSRPAYIYDQTKNIEVCKQILGHINCGATSHYLGIDKNKALDISSKYSL